MDTEKHVELLVLDATPLITQSASALQQYAVRHFTTPGVKAELRDDNARNQLLLWGDKLEVRQPKQVFIDKVSAFAKLTGDYSVLSMNDIHIIALAYELEHEKNGDATLRKFPGEKLGGDDEKEKLHKRKPRFQKNEAEDSKQDAGEAQEDVEQDDDGFQVVTRKHRKTSWKQRRRPQNSHVEAKAPVTEQVNQAVQKSEHSISEPSEENKDIESSNETPQPQDFDNVEAADETGDGDSSEEDDDGDWITPGNLQETIMKDKNETVRDAPIEKDAQIAVAITTGDFACQNVSMQIGLKLMNHLSGKQIKSVKNFMYRCHACFKMTPMHKLGERKHFCPKCGGDTMIRCAVSIDNVTGKITPHLKKNFKWITRGQVYSMASPLSKNTQKKQGNGGHQHNKENRHKDLQEPVILREDQREYADAIKEDAWRRRKSEKMLQEFVGGGSADNIISPFGASNRSSGVRVGRGRNANAAKGKRK
ncbi:D-site 20S pre-rRNA nuclease [Metschnikowia bicuspidata var. bicuspidata NRRL YB-4993]|uniref:20S-pre-rRNA D-site endonuclease NOB1 n=1 Tax=Metschnikowia bicuspidata var. bicuspidata NRRL YB-4993 TaxID=869754 RepID=A0A1A0H205_9ASCO|nr:D-site 20S pre-rRNA nuclease [Metschnikowia bicuspidata var. bicuspidata NRRL YB-4993]OBA17985.1 D-site 20S pre-rRNA nuclease [Metschnikowia bicuspidata var. bicuspidata NRRL YB-4993]